MLFIQVHFPDRERAEWLNEVPLVAKSLNHSNKVFFIDYFIALALRKQLCCQIL